MPKPSITAEQSKNEMKTNPPNIRNSSKQSPSFTKFHIDETGNSVLFQSKSYSDKNETERDWSGVKYDPAWDDGSAFPPLDKDWGYINIDYQIDIFFEVKVKYLLFLALNPKTCINIGQF